MNRRVAISPPNHSLRSSRLIRVHGCSLSLVVSVAVGSSGISPKPPELSSRNDFRRNDAGALRSDERKVDLFRPLDGLSNSAPICSILPGAFVPSN
jgi:hypothetical protein